MQRSCAIIIPVYNEDRAIASTVKRLHEICKQLPDYDFEIICIDDGSSDRSGDDPGRAARALPSSRTR